MLSSEHNVTCCFPIPHHAFSQFEIDSSGSQRESGRGEQNIAADTKAICAFKSRHLSREVTALSGISSAATLKVSQQSREPENTICIGEEHS